MLCPHRGHRTQAPDAFRLNPPSQLVIEYHWLAFLNHPNFRCIFHDDSKNKNRKIDSIFHKNGIKTESKGVRGVCISLVGTGPKIVPKDAHIMERIFMFMFFLGFLVSEIWSIWLCPSERSADPPQSQKEPMIRSFLDDFKTKKKLLGLIAGMPLTLTCSD